MRASSRSILAMAASAACLASWLVPAAARAAACSTANPASDFSAQITWNGDQDIQNNFTAARAAEGCNVTLVLPAGYDAMTPQQQMLWLFNNEREVRGLGDFSLDSTLLSQISFNHSQEMAQYGYFEHQSPINAPNGDPFFGRVSINPAYANTAGGEDIAAGYSDAAQATFGYMYQDSGSDWGHRANILGTYNTVGIGVVLNAANSQWGNYWTDDFSQQPASYTPPATADTNPPVIGQVSYANGTATASGVADSPNNVNDTGANPLTAGITDVVFYTNNIVDLNMDGSAYNTVQATQSSPGTWTAAVTVNPGDVLHAVAVDGSGNFTDVAAPPTAVTLTAGANTMALPAAGATATTTTMARLASADSGGQVPAATPTAAALATSIDKQAGHKVVKYVKVYVDGHWRTYTPGTSANFALYTSQGVVVGLAKKTTWRPPARTEENVAPTLHLRKGWNFVAVPYPVTGMTCHATRLELARLGVRLEQITVGPAEDVGVIMKPKHGQWGNDLTKHLPYQNGFWLKVSGATTWVPSPTGFGSGGDVIR